MILFDVWDNRQFSGFVHHAGELRRRIAREIDREPRVIARAEALLDRVLACRDFEQAYRVLASSTSSTAAARWPPSPTPASIW